MPFQGAINNILGDDIKHLPEGKVRVGTYTLRKTAYLFAVFGTMARYEGTGRAVTNTSTSESLHLHPLEADSITKGARHSD